MIDVSAAERRRQGQFAPVFQGLEGLIIEEL